MPLIAFTPENAAGYMGAGYVRAMMEQVTATSGYTLWADCGDNPATCMQALQAGLRHLVSHTHGEVFAKLSDMASQQNAVLRNDRPAQALDMRNADAAALQAWLRQACA